MYMDSIKKGSDESDKFLEIEVKEKGCSMIELKYNVGKDMITGAFRGEKLKGLIINRQSSNSGFKLWALRFAIMVLLAWACITQLTTLGVPQQAGKIMMSPPTNQTKRQSHSLVVSPQRVYKNNGYLMVSSNGGLNQMRSGICDMVVVARYLNVTLIVPELDNTSFWNDRSRFQDIFDVNYFINSLRDEARIIKELPPKQKRRVAYVLHSMPPVSWSNISYYYNTILPLIKKHEILHLTKTDSRLANNGLPEEVQRLRCRVNYKALRFTPTIEALGKKIVSLLRQKGPFLVLHLRYEMDMLAFSGCTEGCNDTEVEELTKMRYAYPWWKEKEINSERKRKAGLCPLTPEETALALQAFEIDSNIQIYIAAGNTYGGERRMAGLRASYPNLVKKETLLPPSDLEPFKNHSNQMAALDYLVSMESDVFVPSFEGNMAKVVEGHRRFKGYKVTIRLDRLVLINLIDQYKSGNLSWNQFSESVKAAHLNRLGSPTQRLKIPGKPKEEDFFYSNPEECLPPLVESRRSRKPDPSSGQS